MKLKTTNQQRTVACQAMAKQYHEKHNELSVFANKGENDKFMFFFKGCDNYDGIFADYFANHDCCDNIHTDGNEKLSLAQEIKLQSKIRTLVKIATQETKLAIGDNNG